MLPSLSAGILHEYPKRESNDSSVENGDYFPNSYSVDVKHSPASVGASSPDVISPGHITFRQRRNLSEVSHAANTALISF